MKLSDRETEWARGVQRQARGRQEEQSDRHKAQADRLGALSVSRQARRRRRAHHEYQRGRAHRHVAGRAHQHLPTGEL